MSTCRQVVTSIPATSDFQAGFLGDLRHKAEAHPQS